MVSATSEVSRVNEVFGAAEGLLGRGESLAAVQGDAEAVALASGTGAKVVLERIAYERAVARALSEASGCHALMEAEFGAILGTPAASDAVWRAQKAGDSPAQAARRVLLAIGARVAP